MKRHFDFTVDETRLNTSHGYDVHYSFDMSSMIMSKCEQYTDNPTVEFPLAICDGELCYRPSTYSNYIALGESFQQKFREYVDSAFEEIMELNNPSSGR